MEIELEFNKMLDIVYNNIDVKMKTTNSQKLVVPNPVLEFNTTNTYWKNVKKILIAINRPPEHFIDFIQNEMKTGEWISSSKSDGIVLIGKYKMDKIMHILQSYIKKYVICNICNSSNTILEKNKDLRSYMIKCNKCNSTYFV
jgi:translation initiation factor 2 subunit 2